MKCFRCDTELTPIDKDTPFHCYGGAIFTSTGNYGSMFDPFDADEVKIVICDDCIIENSSNIIAVNKPYIIEPKPEFSTWKYINSKRKI